MRVAHFSNFSKVTNHWKVGLYEEDNSYFSSWYIQAEGSSRLCDDKKWMVFDPSPCKINIIFKHKLFPGILPLLEFTQGESDLDSVQQYREASQLIISQIMTLTQVVWTDYELDSTIVPMVNYHSASAARRTGNFQI
jgi:hypothetical protein